MNSSFVNKSASVSVPNAILANSSVLSTQQHLVTEAEAPEIFFKKILRL
jgi:hypothetical protein